MGPIIANGLLLFWFSITAPAIKLWLKSWLRYSNFVSYSTIVTLCSAIVSFITNGIRRRKASKHVSRSDVTRIWLAVQQIAQVGSRRRRRRIGKVEVKGWLGGQGAVSKGSLQGQSPFFSGQETRLVSPYFHLFRADCWNRLRRAQVRSREEQSRLYWNGRRNQSDFQQHRFPPLLSSSLVYSSWPSPKVLVDRPTQLIWI